MSCRWPWLMLLAACGADPAPVEPPPDLAAEPLAGEPGAAAEAPPPEASEAEAGEVVETACQWPQGMRHGWNATRHEAVRRDGTPSGTSLALRYELEVLPPEAGVVGTRVRASQRVVGDPVGVLGAMLMMFDDVPVELVVDSRGRLSQVRELVELGERIAGSLDDVEARLKAKGTSPDRTGDIIGLARANTLNHAALEASVLDTYTPFFLLSCLKVPASGVALKDTTMAHPRSRGRMDALAFVSQAGGELRAETKLDPGAVQAADDVAPDVQVVDTLTATSLADVGWLGSGVYLREMSASGQVQRSRIDYVAD